MLRSVNKNRQNVEIFLIFLKIKKKRNVFSFFKKVLFGCASLAARERARTKKSARDTANTKPNGRAQRSVPRLSSGS